MLREIELDLAINFYVKSLNLKERRETVETTENYDLSRKALANCSRKVLWFFVVFSEFFEGFLSFLFMIMIMKL
jgi:hypothetical protein